MRWKIVYYSTKVADEVASLPKKLLARYMRMADVMMEYGPDLGMPHSRSMGDGLLELRLKAKEGIARVFYCTVINNQIMVLHCIRKKSQKTPPKALKLARSRLKEVLNHD